MTAHLDRLSALEINSGSVVRSAGAARFVLPGADARRYSNAQLYDYAGLRRRDFPARPPVRLACQARFSHRAAALRGTAGFGFWNQPFMPGALGLRLPRQVWFFFGGAPHNMALAKGVPGAGWKAATADFSRLSFLLLAPAAPLGFLLMRTPSLYERLWPLGQRAIGVYEALLPHDMRDWHTYRLDWLPRAARFYVDGALVLEAGHAPRGPLGFVAWMDNQYAVLTPQGRLGMGLVAIDGPQWMEVADLAVESL
ncbi:MAG: hypothetical protein IT323_03295 [Anaerolineae bacterium]|nr:hypothetical protein [Anaerolineae bacterium]